MNIEQMAHEYMEAEIRRIGLSSIDENRVYEAWRIAESMQAESDKRKVKGVPEVIQNTNKINCWSCGHTMTKDARSLNDGDCPNCNVEIEL